MPCTNEEPCLQPMLRWVHSKTCRKLTTPAPKRYHYAAKIRSDGQASALCFDPPRPIDLRRASWTNRREAVTCPKCRSLLAAPAPTASREEDDREP